MERTMSRFHVLITGAGSTTAVTVLKGIRLLNDSNIRVFMGDMRPDCAGAYLGDQFVCMPRADHPAFQSLVVDICRRFAIDLVIPIIDYEFCGWSQVAPELLTRGTRVVVSTSDVVAQCDEKDLTIQYFESIGVPCPQTWKVVDIKNPNELQFPVFIKPRCGRGSQDAHRADNIAEYRYYTSKTGDLIVQPCLQGREITVDTMSDFEGSFLAASPRIRVEIRSGQAYRSVTVANSQLVTYAQKIVENFPIIGPSNIQCFLNDSGPQFFEINARFGAGTALSIAAGLNGPAALVAMAQWRKLPPLKPRAQVKMLRYWQEVFVECRKPPLFFDLDGPLLDVSYRHYQVYCDILQHAGYGVVSYEQYWSDKRDRIPHRKIVARTADENFYNSTFKKQWLEHIETDAYLELDRLWPWTIEVVAQLYPEHHLYLLTVRSFPEQLTKQLERLGLTQWFQEILCKPARENAGREKIHAIRRHFSSVPSPAIIIGDTEADMECGSELQFTTIGVTGGIRNRQQLEATACDYLLEDIRTLPHVIAKITKDGPCNSVNIPHL